MRLSVGPVLTEHLSRRFFIDRLKCNQILVLIITFFLYTTLHLSRRPISIVKSQLHHNCSVDEVNHTENVEHRNDPKWCDWKPFDGEDAELLLGWLDTTYLLTYAIFMFVAGYIAERCNLRYFLTVSLFVCGIMTILFGIAYPLNIHMYWYFVVVQVLTGIVQTTGWPAVVAVVGNWYGSDKKGLVFGIWSWHTAVGNIAGAVIAGAFVEENWGLSFTVPGLICLGMALIVFFFLIPTPQSVGLSNGDKPIESNSDKVEVVVKVKDGNLDDDNHAISFFGALKLPGVIEFSVCLFFAKLVGYTFLYWLPLYINQSIDVSPSQSAYLSIMFDIGGGFGGILTGYMADKTEANAITCIAFLVLAIPSLFAYYLWGPITMASNQCLQFIAGMFVNGPYSLISTAVCADLATKVKSSAALATVTAIIGGTGSIGAAAGPALAGYVAGYGWEYVFYMVMFADFLAVVSLLRAGINEFKKLYALRNLRKIEAKIDLAFDKI